MIALLLCIQVQVGHVAATSVVQEERLCSQRGFPMFGRVVAGVGDVDRDGVPDVLVADPGSGDECRGAVWLLSGKDGTVLRSAFSEALGDGFGSDVRGAGDVDKDGVPDWIVGARDKRGDAIGYAVVFSGKTGKRLFTLRGRTKGSLFGSAVSGAGDVDHDGYADVIVGAPNAVEREGEIGAAYIYSGKDGSLLRVITTKGIESLVPRVATDNGVDLGIDLCGVGDVDADGFDDVVVARRIRGKDLAQFCVISGKDGRLLRVIERPSDHEYRLCVRSAGDLDSDRRADFILASGGWAQWISGRNGSVLRQFEGSKRDWFGSCVAVLPSTQSPAHPCTVVSEPAFQVGTGRVHFFFGRSGAEALALGPGLSDGSWGFGTSLACIGDIDGDGVADLAVGTDNAQSHESGLVQLLSGKDGTLIRELRRAPDGIRVSREIPSEARVATRNTIHSTFGCAVSGIGDVDGDGVPDLLIVDASSGDGGVFLASLGTRKTRFFPRSVPEGLTFTAQIRSLGDVDGDGTSDWIVGGLADPPPRPRETSAEHAKRAAEWPSSASVHSGRNGALLHHFTDEHPGQKLGCSVAPAGDVDHDGHADILLGATRVSVEDPNDGVAYIRSGRDGRILSSFGNDLPLGARAYQVESVGDVDGDGVADIAVVCSNEWDDRSCLRIYSGKTGKALVPKAVEHGVILCMRSAGDFDHDGRSDLLVGIRGTARLISGRDASTLLELSSAGLEPSAYDQPVPASYGKSIAILRGKSDSTAPTIVVSAIDTAVFGGTIYFHSSKNGSLLCKITDTEIDRAVRTDPTEPPLDIHHVGYSLANIGDVDGDGFEDLACGVNSVEGGAQGMVFVFSGRDGSLMYEIGRRDDTAVVIDRRKKH
jgi:hypothetical protein